MSSKSTLLSKLVISGAIALICAPVCAAAFNPQIPIWLAILIGAVTGAPLLVIGFRLDPGPPATPHARIEGAGLPAPNQGTSQQFWPTRIEVWGMVGLVTWFATLLVPCLLFFLLFALVPAGDHWPIVFVRVSLVTIATGVSYWWIKFARKKLLVHFRDQISDTTMDLFVTPESPTERSSPMETALQNWQLLVLVAVAFFVAASVLSFRIPEPILDDGPRRLRGVVRLLAWCRSNPNTVMASAVWVGCGALALYVYRVIRASVDSSRIDL